MSTNEPPPTETHLAPPPPPGPGAPPAPPASAGPGPAWNATPATGAPRSRRNWAIGCIVLVVLLLVGVASCSFVLFKSFGGAGAVIAA